MTKSLINEFDKEISESSMVLESADIINQIFKALKLTFPAWRQNFKTEKEYLETKELWLETLIDEKITTQEKINLGLKGARSHSSPFFPSIGQFIKWSQKEKPRVNEQAYRPYKPKIAAHTQEEYKEFAKDGLAKLRKNHDF